MPVAGMLRPLPAQPLYVDPPEARLPRRASARRRPDDRPATAAHAAAPRDNPCRGFPPREAWGEDAIALQLVLPGAFGLIDERGGMLMGRVAADEAEVLTLAVAPAVRRQGLATALLRAAGTRSARAAAMPCSSKWLPATPPHWCSTGARASSRWADVAATMPICRTRWCCELA